MKVKCYYIKKIKTIIPLKLITFVNLINKKKYLCCKFNYLLLVTITFIDCFLTASRNKAIDSGVSS